MNELNWSIVAHRDLTNETRICIAELKNQHWSYGIESQLNWMSKNVHAEDSHLLGVDRSGTLRAYLTLVRIKVDYGEEENDAVGIGGVCVDKSVEHIGLGKQLVATANAYIESKTKIGLLLCKDGLVEFYKKCKWITVDCETAYVGGQSFDNIIMTYPFDLKCKRISIDRNF